MDKYRILVKGIVKYEDHYLILKKWYDDRIADPYQWDFVDGSLEFMEEPDKAVLRHIYEQTGIPVMIDKLLYTWTFLTGDVFNIGISYLCIASLDNVVISEELNDYLWITKEEFPEYLNKKVLDDIERVDLEDLI
ncbi:MAG: hydrolase [Herbinix sp.]|jgi:8-oxo-dGTP pyrophosphatase MutT (NUDIX family)|nr:hydrolase [Herbinix sp.]